jgi:hypothetical protein
MLLKPAERRVVLKNQDLRSTKKMKRHIFYLYKRLLKENGKIVSLKDIFQLYDDYEDVRMRIEGDLMPRSFDHNMPKIKLPKYLKWIKEYLK